VIVLLQIIVLIPLFVGMRFIEPEAALGPETMVDAVVSFYMVTSGNTMLRLVFQILAVVLLWKEPSVKKGFALVFVLVSLFWVIVVATGLDPHYTAVYHGGRLHLYIVLQYLYELIAYCVGAVAIMIIRNVRRHVRAKYAIRPVLFSSGTSQDASFDDCLLAWCCGCCTTAQMLRHTTDYKKYGSSMCSDRGVPPGAPHIL
jgi:hypothetical protein